jgi:phage protein D
MPDDRPFLQVRLQDIDITADVRSVDVEDHDRLTDQATIVLHDPSMTAAEVPREGQRVVIELGWSCAHAVVFEGIVFRVQIATDADARQQITLTAFDLSYLLRRRPSRSTNHVGRLSAIVRAIVTRAPAIGVTVGQIEPEPDPEFTDAAPLRQTSQTDWDFILQLADRYGCRAFVEYNGGASKFYFISVNRFLQNQPLGKLSYSGTSGRILRIEYDRLASAASPARTAVASDGVTGETPPAQPAQAAVEPPATPLPSTRARAPAGGDQLDHALQVAGEATVRPEQLRPVETVPGLPSDPARAALASRSDPTSALGLRARGVCSGVVTLRAKGQVELEGVAAWATGAWYVRQVNHLMNMAGGSPSPAAATPAPDPGYTTRFLLTR